MTPMVMNHVSHFMPFGSTPYDTDGDTRFLNLNNPNFVVQRWQGMLFYWFILAYVLALNVWGSRILPHVNIAAGVLHVVGFVAITTVLGAMTEEKHTAAYVFTEVSNTSGWKSDGISWLVGLLSTVYPFLGSVSPRNSFHFS